MKKILSILFAVCFTAFAMTEAIGQSSYSYPTSGNRTITAADTLPVITGGVVPSKIMSIQYTYTETSGTTAGKVYLEASNDLTNYVLLDSLTLADVATAQTKIVTLTKTYYRSYRWRNTNTSSATGAVRSWMLRRHDE